MHICIVGTGASGLICCNLLKNIQKVEKITIIGSPHIPTIGVGESNTLTFTEHFLNKLIRNGEFTREEFFLETDATIKYGVYYKNWSRKDYLHHFKCYYKDYKKFFRLLAKKNPKTYIHDIFEPYLLKNVLNNKVFLNIHRYPISYHFDASKFIEFFLKIALKNEKVKFISGTVSGGVKKEDIIEKIYVDGEEIKADYYVFATGDSKINDNFLEIKYKNLSDILLTNKAIVYPLEYKNKRREFTPYTKAKTMKCGWRWITPTWSRIGTGYVFSDNYISVDKAVDEFLSDIGNKKLNPLVVDFHPKYNETAFHTNYCTIGMAHGFLEPLDAPGITLTIDTIVSLIDIFQGNTNINDANQRVKNSYEFWCSFILCQYKTCHRNDTAFWRDHKLIKYDFYDKIMDILDLDDSLSGFELSMFKQTIASKDIQWKTSETGYPKKIEEKKLTTVHHLDYIQKCREKLILSKSNDNF